MSTENIGINITSTVGNAVPNINSVADGLEDIGEAALSASAGLDRAGRAADRTRDDMGRFRRETDNAGGAFNALTKYIAGAVSVGALINFGKQLIDITSKYEAFEAVLRNSLGADEAARSFRLIQDFAATTPFQVDEITGSFIKLVNRGFKPTQDQLRQIGDLAASQNKSFDQLTEAILDAQTGEFERLKDFGIKASQAGDKVTLSFRGQTQVVEKNSTAVRDAILALGDYEGIAGSTAVVSGTLGGQISNLSDNWDRFMAALGKNLLPVISLGVEALSADLELLNDIVESSFKALKNDGGVKDTGARVYDEALKRLQSARKAGEGVLKGELQLIQKDIAANNKQIENLTFQLATGAIKGSFRVRNAANKVDALNESNRALNSALNQFNIEAKGEEKGTAFGSAKTTKNVKTLSDVLAKLRSDLNGIEVSFAAVGGSVEKLSEDKIRTIASAFRELATFGVKPGTEIFDQLKSEIQVLQATLTHTPLTIKFPVNIEPLPSASNAQTVAKVMKGINDSFRPQLNQFTKDINALIQESVINGFDKIGEGIGEALTGGGLQPVLSSFISVIADFGSKLGKQLIVQGFAIEAFTKSLQTLQGVGAIAAGVALVAASAAFKSLAGKGVSSFATGGGVYSPQLAMIGDNPGREEYVIPSEVLDKMGGGGGGELEARFSVDEMIIWLNRGMRNNG